MGASDPAAWPLSNTEQEGSRELEAQVRRPSSGSRLGISGQARKLPELYLESWGDDTLKK